MDESSRMWRKCSTCKQPIPYGSDYYVCSVSTCNRGPGYVFCSVACWDSHVPVMRHRKAWAEERTAPPGPARDEGPNPAVEPAGADTRAPRAGGGTMSPSGVVPPRRRIRVRPRGGPKDGTAPGRGKPADDILVVVSKVREYVRARSGMATSAGVYDILSDRIRDLCDRAIDAAREDGRKTVMDRDVP